MEIKLEELKRCDLITINGRIDSSNAKDIEAVFKKAMNSGQYRFVIDMSGVEYISSAFLRVMIAALKDAKRWNRGNIYLAAMPPKIVDVFNLAGLLHEEKPMFQVYATVAQAVGDW